MGGLELKEKDAVSMGMFPRGPLVTYETCLLTDVQCSRVHVFFIFFTCQQFKTVLGQNDEGNSICNLVLHYYYTNL